MAVLKSTRIVLYLFCTLVVSITVHAQEKIMVRYTELKDPKPVNTASWNNLPSQVMISFADIDTRYSKSNAPAISNL